jgi:hypothetical protein
VFSTVIVHRKRNRSEEPLFMFIGDDNRSVDLIFFFHIGVCDSVMVISRPVWNKVFSQEFWRLWFLWKGFM